MRNFTEFINEAKALEIQEETINYIGVKDLKTYLKITDRFISEPAKYIINYLIDNNASYIKTLGKGGENALADFYSAGKPKNDSLQELYKNIGILNKGNRLLEVPVFQTKEQFDGIISKTISPDEVLLDLTSEKGRTEVVKKYMPLVMKMVNNFKGKSTLDTDELKAQALLGLTLAMNSYGKKTDKSANDGENIKATTFLQYASYNIHNLILDGIQNSHMVRVPLSVQKKEREEKGANTRVNHQSGDEHVGHDKDGGEGKTIFDLLGFDSVDAETNLNRQDLAKVDARMNKLVKEKFGEMCYDIFASFFGIWGHKKMQNKELAKKYGCGESKITYYIKKPILAMKGGDKELTALANDMNELMAESRRLADIADDDPFTSNSMLNENDSFE